MIPLHHRRLLIIYMFYVYLARMVHGDQKLDATARMGLGEGAFSLTCSAASA